MTIDRRSSARHDVELFVNKYIDGVPHLCEALEISETGILLRRIHEPEAERAAYAIELGALGSESVWLCAASVWSVAGFEALGFLASSDADRERIAALIAAARPTPPQLASLPV